MKQKKQALTITIAIPTCYGGESLRETIKSIRKSVGVSFRLMVTADTVPITAAIKKDFARWGVVLTENKTRGSQMKKVKQMLAKCQDDIFIFTQDDIRFAPDAIRHIHDAFTKNRRLSMVATTVYAAKPRTPFQAAIETGSRISLAIAKKWRGGDNYLAANGRCIAFRTSFLKKIRIPDTIVNSDAYLYFAVKRKGGMVRFVKKASVYNTNPGTLDEYIKQRRRFLYSQREISSLFPEDISREYRVPRPIAYSVIIKEFFRSPAAFLSYCSILAFAHIKLNLLSRHPAPTPFWEVAKSTKR